MIEEHAVLSARDSYSKFAGSPFRLGQREAVEFAAESPSKVVVICAPTGSGKSVLGMTAGATKSKFLYLCSSKQLQNQIIKDFPEAESMKGRANYPCLAIPGFNASQCIHSQRTPCDLKKEGCPYEEQKTRVLNHDKQILNYVYFLTEANYVGKFSGYPIVIADEADVIEGTLSGLVGLSFSVQQMYRLGIPAPQYSSFNAAGSDRAWHAWCQTASSIVRSHMRSMEKKMDGVARGSDDHLRLLKDLQHLNDLVEKIKRFEESFDDTWIVDKRKKDGRVVTWSMKPVWLNGDLVEKYFWRHGQKFVLMSATFPHKDVMAELLGLQSSDIDMREIPSTFSAGNRPVYLSYACDMRSERGLGISRDEIKKLLDQIVEIMAKHKGEKGIIHTVNWVLNDAVMSIGDPRLITHDPLNKMSQLKDHLGSPNGSVFVSPSSTRGLDLPDDECRFSIIAKCPYKNLGDKLVSARVYGSRHIGQYWYRSICAQDLVQAVGRGVRHDKDWCVNYVLDKQACNLITDYPALFPQYFKDAVDVL